MLRALGHEDGCVPGPDLGVPGGSREETGLLSAEPGQCTKAVRQDPKVGLGARCGCGGSTLSLGSAPKELS